MEHNPYTAPQTSLDSPAEAPPAPRPIAVWILSIILIVLALLALVGFAGFLWMIGSHADAVGGGVLMVEISWRVAFIALFIAVPYGAFRRQRWARWVGALVIAGIAIFAIVRQDTTQYASDAERAGGYVGRYLIFPLLLAWWAYAFAFSAKARRYFSKA